VREAPEPNGDLLAETRRHLALCPTCQAHQEELSALHASLRAMPPPRLPDGFELGLRRRLAQERSIARPAAGRRMSRLAAVAALLAVIIGGGLSWWLLSAGPGNGPVTYHRIHLAAKTAVAHEALFDLHLPDGLTVAPGVDAIFGRDRVVRWRAELRPGVSSFDLPVQTRGAVGPLRAEMQINGRTLTTTIHLAQAAHHRTSRAEQEIGTLALLMVSQREEGVR
jgi:hypothetical protein